MMIGLLCVTSEHRLGLKLIKPKTPFNRVTYES